MLKNDTLMVSLVLFMSFARVLCNRYDARWISKTKSQNTRKWRNGGIINPLFDGLTYNTSGHFAHCSYFFSPLRGSEKYYTTRKISARIQYVKPSNKVYIFTELEENNCFTDNCSGDDQKNCIFFSFISFFLQKHQETASLL